MSAIFPKQTVLGAQPWYLASYCNHIGKDNLYCGCQSNKLYGNFCGTHKSEYLLNSDKLINYSRFTKCEKDYNIPSIKKTLINIYKNNYMTNNLVYNYLNINITKNEPHNYNDPTAPKFKMILNKLNLKKPELFNHLKILIDYVSKKELHEFYDKNKNNIIKVQSIFRKNIITFSNKYKGPGFPFINRCCNDEDFFSFSPLNEIESDYFFSYKDRNNNIWGFDIRSFKKLIQLRQNNPYNRDPIPSSVRRQLKRRLKQLEYKKIQTEIVKPPDENIDDYLNHRLIDIMQHISQFGYSVSDTWYTALNLAQLKSLYANLEDIWNYRAQLSINVKRNICPPLGFVFRDSQSYINNQTDIKQMSKILLDNVYKLVFTGVTEGDQKLGAMYFLIGLGKINPACFETIPWLQYV